MSEFFKNIKKGLVDPYEEEYEEEEQEVNSSAYEQANNEDVRRMNAKMVIIEPRSFDEDAKTIGNYLLSKKGCVVNIHRLQESNAIRLLDFLSGVTYAIGGSIQKIDAHVFLFAPRELPVDGTIESDN